MTTTPERSPDRPQQLATGAGTSASTGDDAVVPTRPAPDDAARLSDTKDLKRLSVRSLLAELASVESRLRSTPFLLSGDGRTQVNPEAALLLARQRAVVEQLRRRRVTWTASAPRERSAAWPPPPWS